jgi:hypothetical protein
MVESLEEWDEQYVQEIAKPGEYDWLEKKASATLDDPRSNVAKQEIAKQVCAFANAGDGFLVFGIDNAGALDAGVLRKVSEQPIEEWIEALIPKQHHPPIYNCAAKFIRVPSHHAADRGVLVVSIPLSKDRPHWCSKTDRNIAYIRAGAHSVEMSHQTLVDIASRSAVPMGRIEGFHCALVSQPMRWVDIWPCARITSGPIAKEWALELHLSPKDSGAKFVYAPPYNLEDQQQRAAYIGNALTLFPGRLTKLAQIRIDFQAAPANPDFLLTAYLYVGSQQPEKRTVRAEKLLKDLYPDSPQYVETE